MKGDCNELGPAGSDGRVVVDGAPGRNGPDGLPGPFGTISEAVINQLREHSEGLGYVRLFTYHVST